MYLEVSVTEKEPLICPFCRGKILDLQWLAQCDRCNSVHHSLCWFETRRCSVFGCQSPRCIPYESLRQKEITTAFALSKKRFWRTMITLFTITALAGCLFATLLDMDFLLSHPTPPLIFAAALSWIIARRQLNCPVCGQMLGTPTIVFCSNCGVRVI